MVHSETICARFLARAFLIRWPGEYVTWEVPRDRFEAGVSPDAPLSASVRAIITHLCEGECHTFGDVLEWCETRGDCQQAVVCPGCATHFLVDDDELAELGRWTDAQGMALVCGVRWD